MVRSVALGIAASFFFAFTFVLNRSMNLQGGSWIWSAVLRFLFMLPLLLAVLLAAGGRASAARVHASVRARPAAWLGWSVVGFGLFYAPLCAASVFGPSWLLAATWQLTIVAGALTTPLFRKAPSRPAAAGERHWLPLAALGYSAVILAGVVLLQFGESRGLPPGEAALGIGLVAVAAFAYPLGNRKMMAVLDGGLNTLERVYGMTLCSLPFWIALGVAGLAADGAPKPVQCAQAFLVALFAGVVATLLFFRATDRARADPHALAVVESTQAGEVVFALLGGVLVFGDRAPSPLGWAGLALVVAGMAAASLSSGKASK